MAKGNALLGTLRGSVGDVTFTQVNGKQVMRKRNTAPKNPKTSKQVYQRMFFATIAKAKQAMSAIVDHSFESIEHGQKSLNYFMKRNIALMRQNAIYDPILQTWTSPGYSFVTPNWSSVAQNPYRISEGSLPPLNNQAKPISVTRNWGEAFDDLFDSWLERDEHEAATLAPMFFTADAPLDWGGASAIRGNLTNLIKDQACKVGDYLTLCVMSARNEDINRGAGVEYYVKFNYIRFKVCEIYDETGLTPGPTGVLTLIPSNIDGLDFRIPNYVLSATNVDSTFWDQVMPHYVTQQSQGSYAPWIDLDSYSNYDIEVFFPGTTDSLSISFNFPVSIDSTIIASTWIHSRPQENGVIKVSTQDLILADKTGDVLDFNLGLRDAYDEWLSTKKVIGDQRYILEGGTL